MAWDLLLLPASTADSTLLPHTKDKWTHIPLLPFWAWYPLMRPHGLDMAIWWYHRRSEGSQDHNGRYFSSWIDLTVTESASKSSAVSAQEGGILYWPASWVAYKRKSGRLHSPVCSQWSTPPHPSSAPLSSERAPFYQSGKLERAPLKWARPSQVGAPLSINQANLSTPFKRGALLPILQQWAKNLEWMKKWPKRNQPVEAERGLTHFSSACLLPV